MKTENSANKNVIVTNSTDKTVTCAAIEFKPGEIQFQYSEIGFFKLAQLKHHPKLNYQIFVLKPGEKMLEPRAKSAKKVEAK